MTASATDLTPVEPRDAVLRHGYTFVRSVAMKESLARFGGLSDWRVFADSWNALELDTYMADGNVMGIHEVTEWSYDRKFDESRMAMPADAVVDESDPKRRKPQS